MNFFSANSFFISRPPGNRDRKKNQLIRPPRPLSSHKLNSNYQRTWNCDQKIPRSDLKTWSTATERLKQTNCVLLLQPTGASKESDKSVLLLAFHHDTRMAVFLFLHSRKWKKTKLNTRRRDSFRLCWDLVKRFLSFGTLWMNRSLHQLFARRCMLLLSCLRNKRFDWLPVSFSFMPAASDKKFFIVMVCVGGSVWFLGHIRLLVFAASLN